jgi:hypothetical protein
MRMIPCGRSCGASLAGQSAQSRSPHCEDNDTHALRRTKASIIYKATARRPDLLGHTNVGSTIRDLGVDVEDALDLEGTGSNRDRLLRLGEAGRSVLSCAHPSR